MEKILFQPPAQGSEPSGDHVKSTTTARDLAGNLQPATVGMMPSLGARPPVTDLRGLVLTLLGTIAYQPLREWTERLLAPVGEGNPPYTPTFRAGSPRKVAKYTAPFLLGEVRLPRISNFQGGVSGQTKTPSDSVGETTPDGWLPQLDIADGKLGVSTNRGKKRDNQRPPVQIPPLLDPEELKKWFIRPDLTRFGADNKYLHGAQYTQAQGEQTSDPGDTGRQGQKRAQSPGEQDDGKEHLLPASLSDREILPSSVGPPGTSTQSHMSLSIPLADGSQVVFEAYIESDGDRQELNIIQKSCCYSELSFVTQTILDGDRAEPLFKS